MFYNNYQQKCIIAFKSYKKNIFALSNGRKAQNNNFKTNDAR